MASNIEEFLIELKLVDKGTLQKVKKFYRDFDKMGGKAHKTQKKRQSELEKFQDAVSKEKLRDVKREQKAKEKAHQEELRRLKQINSARRRIMRSTQFQRLKDRDRKEAAEFLKNFKRKGMSGDIEGMKDLKARLNDTASSVSNLRRQQLGLSTVQNGLKDSTRNMVRTFASMFALFEGTQAINRVGQQFEGMRASMLAASGGAKAAKEDLAFIREEAVRLGTDLVDSSDAFVKLKFAGKDSMSDSDIKNLFTGFSEFATALQVDKFRQQKGMMALTQMMNKSSIMAEELNKYRLAA